MITVYMAEKACLININKYIGTLLIYLSMVFNVCTISGLFSLKRHVAAINKLADAGMYFWDYGNAFLLEASRAGSVCIHTRLPLSLSHQLYRDSAPPGADVGKPGEDSTVFRYPSYVQDIMGWATLPL